MEVRVSTLQMEPGESALIWWRGSIFLVGKRRVLTSPLSLCSLLLFPSHRWGGRNPLPVSAHPGAASAAPPDLTKARKERAKAAQGLSSFSPRRVSSLPSPAPLACLRACGISWCLDIPAGSCGCPPSGQPLLARPGCEPMGGPSSNSS